MNETHGILIFGPNGAGKTTLARELARLLDYKHMDIEDYAFAPSELPYTNPRSRDECTALMRADIEIHRQFVLSAVTGAFGAEIERHYKLAVHLTAPKDLRMRRLEQRGVDADFLAWAAVRDLSHIDKFAQTLACPVIQIDNTQDWRIAAQQLKEKLYAS